MKYLGLLWLRYQANANLRHFEKLGADSRLHVATGVRDKLDAAVLVGIAPASVAEQIVSAIYIAAVDARNQALANGAQGFQDTDWLTASLVEDWAALKLAEFRGRISGSTIKRHEIRLHQLMSTEPTK